MWLLIEKTLKMHYLCEFSIIISRSFCLHELFYSIALHTMSKQTYETVQLIKETIQELYCRFQPFIGAIFYIITKMSFVNDPGDLI